MPLNARSLPLSHSPPPLTRPIELESFRAASSSAFLQNFGGNCSSAPPPPPPPPSRRKWQIRSSPFPRQPRAADRRTEETGGGEGERERGRGQRRKRPNVCNVTSKWRSGLLLLLLLSGDRQRKSGKERRCSAAQRRPLLDPSIAFIREKEARDHI